MRCISSYVIIICTAALYGLSACTQLDAYNRVNQQTILIETPMTNGASCSLTDRSGRVVYAGDTPTSVTAPVGRPPLTVLCWKDGYKKARAHIDENYITIQTFPTILEEFTGFLKDPFKQPGARYPQTIHLWLEPMRWPSASYKATWEKKHAAYVTEQEHIRLEKIRNEESLNELELLLKYRKEHESIRDPRYDGGFLDYLKLRARRLAGGSMIPDLVREDTDLDQSLNNLTAEELAEEYLEFKRLRYLKEHKDPSISPSN